MLFTTANDMIKLKIKRNFNILEMLELESKISKLEMLIRYRLLKSNAAYIKEIKKITAVEVRQLNEYSLSREAEILKLTCSLNNIDFNIAELQSEIRDLKNQCIAVIDKINKLDESIPENGSVTNIRIR
jgi:uncharacterized protein YlxW (UPF0749 family)